MLKDSRGVLRETFDEACPQQMLDWDYDKNTIDPSKIFKNSNELINLVCHKCGYRWVASVYRVAYGRSKCPICYGKRTPKIGESDLFTLRPELKKDWDYTKNTINPLYLGINTNYYAYWVCHVCGHKWGCRLDSRSKNGSGCPACSYKGGTSCAEYLIYLLLKDLGAENRKRLFGYEYDVVLNNYIIEYNGCFWHSGQEYRDLDKVETAESNGYRVYVLYERDDSILDCTIDDNIAYIPRLNEKTFNFYKDKLPIILKRFGVVDNNFNISSEISSMSYAGLRSKVSTPVFEKSVKHALDVSNWSWSVRNKNIQPDLIYANNNVYVWVSCLNGHDVPMRADTIVKYGCRICRNSHGGVVKITDNVLLKHFQQLFREDNIGEFKHNYVVNSLTFFLYSTYYEVGIVIVNSTIQIFILNENYYKVGEFSFNRHVSSHLVCSYLDNLYKKFECIYNKSMDAIAKAKIKEG